LKALKMLKGLKMSAATACGTCGKQPPQGTGEDARGPGPLAGGGCELGLVNLAGERAAEPFGDGARGLHDPVQVDAGLDAHAVQHVEQVFGGEVAGSARSVGTATESAGRGVEDEAAELERAQRVRQGRPAGV